MCIKTLAWAPGGLSLRVSVDLETFSVFVFVYLYPLIFHTEHIFPCNKKQSWTCICREVLFLRTKESKIMSRQEELLCSLGLGVPIAGQGWEGGSLGKNDGV